jgi:HD-GYP domain-containing protein (c-di-GMP phosphodiesterase class II)
VNNRSKRSTSSDCIIYHGPATDPDAFATPPEELPRWRSAAELSATVADNAPAVFIADAALAVASVVMDMLPNHVVIVAADVATERALGERVVLSVAEFRDAASRRRILRAACQLSCARIGARERRRHLVHINSDLRQLVHIGMELMCQRDRDMLLHDIMALGKELTASDGAALFLAESREGEKTTLQLASHAFTSLTDPQMPGDVQLAIDNTTIIGHAALTKKPLVIDDAYDLPPGADYQRNAEFDARNNYRIRSMLIEPMLDQRDQLVGVLVLVNRMSDPTGHVHNEADADRYVLPYRGREVRSARALASQAAISVENSRLYARIEGILESFVSAAVTAVDARDPSTAGHSLRVAMLTVELAKAVEREGRGEYRNLHFSPAELRELRFAALLHDFGKLSVHEDVLLKAKKLPPVLWERVNARFDLIRRTLEADHYRACAALEGDDPHARACREDRLARDLEELERLRTMVREANEPSVTDKSPTLPLRELAGRTFVACDGTTTPYLTEEELHFLELQKGTLDARERAEVESHARESFQFLDQIPWTDDLKHVADYAHGHHEKLDGSGYPQRLRAAAIPVQTRLITLADMFDALTAADRPYKPAVTPQRAFDIIEMEARAGLLDPELVRVMRESDVYQIAASESE